VEPFDGQVEIRFQRTVGERPSEGSPSDAVIVSPQTGEISVSTRGDRIEVAMEGGFLERTVYRVTVLPRFRDRFQNGMAGVYDLVFSTGGELEPNMLAGVTQDRLTLNRLGGVRVDAVSLDGGARQSTVSDSAGVFAFPYIPAGRYDLVAFEDRNRNREADFTEPQGSGQVGVNLGDTIVVTDLALLLPDTTAAEVQAVGVLDSVTVRVTLDDALDPESGLEGVTGRLVREGANAPEVVEILFRHEWDRRRAQAADPDAPPPAISGPTPPSRELVLLLSRPLIEGAQYRVEVDGVVNLSGVPGGGGSAELEGPGSG
jgi:hypothetical protein